MEDILTYPEDWDKIAESLDFVESEKRQALLKAVLILMLRS